MSEQIAPCPMPYCGAECRECISADGFGSVHCRLCDYRTGNREAHNALCADVELARNLRSALGVHLAMRISDNAGGTLPRFEVQAFENVPPDGGGSIVYRRDTLDAALAELAKKIGGGR